MAKCSKGSGTNACKASSLSEIARKEEQHLAHLVAEGVIVLGSGSLPDGFWESERPADPNGAVAQDLLEERGSQPLDSP